MIYALVLIIFTTPQTIVTIGTGYSIDTCMKRAAMIKFENEIGKAACVPAGFEWRQK
jgi:hypothetical protein